MHKDPATRGIEKTAKAGGPSFTPDIIPGSEKRPQERTITAQIEGNERPKSSAACNKMEKARRTIGADLENYGAVKKPEMEK